MSPKLMAIILHLYNGLFGDELTMALIISGTTSKYILTKWSASVRSQAQRAKGRTCIAATY